jgi:hypothetical protein
MLAANIPAVSSRAISLRSDEKGAAAPFSQLSLRF